MKRVFIKVAVCIAVFIATLFISSSVYNQGNTDMTAVMATATLPLVHITDGSNDYNYLHGLTREMKGGYLSDTVTPLGDGRTMSFVVDKYGNTITGMSFEVRSVDGSRLVEKTDITDYKEDNDRITAKVTIKDLIEPDTEYNWILLINIGSEDADNNEDSKAIRYYTRIMDIEECHTKEKLEFVKDFHNKTFDKDAANDLVPYLESNSKGDNSTYSKVDIHSSFNQVTWGDLNVTRETEPDIAIQETDKQTAAVWLKYRVSIKEGKTKYKYNICEYYRIRYTSDRMYLIEFERTMNQIFNPEADVYANNKIMLGIRNSNVRMKESDGGSNLAFVNEKQLLCYHAEDKKIAYLFSFYDENEKMGSVDQRSIYDAHDIKILNVDETGNVSFIVYGYMNRGKHEGEIGIEVYEYNGMLNTIEEQIFIPYDKSFATLRADVEQLSYINKSGVYYLYLDGSIFAIDLIGQTYTEIASNLQQGSFQVSDSDEMLVWQNSADAYNCTKLILMDLNTGERKEINAGSNSCIMPLGFIQDDLIYGEARHDDVMVDSTGAVTFPMYVVYIQNEQGDILKKYEQSGIYVTGASISGNLITLTRVQKGSLNGYVSATDDQIVNNVVEDNGYNTSETVATQNYETIVQIALKSGIEVKSLKVTRPKEVLFEGTRDIDIEVDNSVDRYYVYGKNEITGTYTQPADAVNKAYEQSGAVINSRGDYIWKRTRSIRNQIMAIEGKMAENGTSQLAVCLETILDYEGEAKNVQSMLENGDTAIDILENSLDNVTVLELKGVSLDAILYYVDRDIPVLATMGNNDAMLIVGYNELNIVVMDPSTGTVYKIGMNDATDLFKEYGNSFITYI